MSPEKVTRKLAAIVAADMVGYSRLMQLDEAGTVARQKACLDELIKPKITEYGGRLVKTTGDGLLVEFPSAVDAVLCAVSIQRAMPGREADIEPDRRISYRIGINLGEIILEGNDIFGDGVNIAARLEALAEPGGIHISQAVYSNVKGKLDLGFSDLGPQTVKNIAEPISTYQVLLSPEDEGKFIKARAEPKITKRRLVQAVLALALVLIFGYFVSGKFSTPAPDSVLTPRLLVLPFSAKNELAGLYATGATENLILSFAQMKGMTTVPRAAAWEYQGLDPDVGRLSTELGIQYVMDGSVLRKHDTLTISARLRKVGEETDQTGKVVWQETFTGEAGKAFELFAKLKTKTTASMQVKLNTAEREILEEIPTPDMKIYLSWIEAVELIRAGGVAGLRKSLKQFKEIVTLAPDFKRAQIGYAWANYLIWLNSYNYTRYALEARSEAEKALDSIFTTDPKYAKGIELRVLMLVAALEHEKALTVARGAIFDQPEEPSLKLALGAALLASGDPESARDEFDAYLKLSPRLFAADLRKMARLYLRLRDAKKALSLLSQVETVQAETFEQYSLLAEAHARLGNIDLARDYQQKVMSIFPFSSLAWDRQIFNIYKDPKVYEDYAEAMTITGLPETAFNLDKTLAEDRLSAEDLKAMFDQVPFKSKESADPLGFPFDLVINKNGKLLLKLVWVAHKPAFSVNWRLEGDQFCTKSPELYRGQEVCSHFYLDRANSTGDTKQYIWLEAFGPFRFSIERLAP